MSATLSDLIGQIIHPAAIPHPTANLRTRAVPDAPLSEMIGRILGTPVPFVAPPAALVLTPVEPQSAGVEMPAPAAG